MGIHPFDPADKAELLALLAALEQVSVNAGNADRPGTQRAEHVHEALVDLARKHLSLIHIFAAATPSATA